MMAPALKRCRCGREFEPRRAWQGHCCTACRRRAFEAGEAEIRSIRQTKTGWSVLMHFKRHPPLSPGQFITAELAGHLTPAAARPGAPQPGAVLC